MATADTSLGATRSTTGAITIEEEPEFVVELTPDAAEFTTVPAQ
jgi:hypothetical protein